MNEPRTAMGFIETVGLVAAIAAADEALKSANVKLIGRENSRGDGMVTVKIAGDVGAVKAAISAAKAAVKPFGTVVSAQVIPRPAVGFGPVMVYNDDTESAADWLFEVAPDETTGKVVTVNGTPSIGEKDRWEADMEKASQRKTKGRRKASSRKKSSSSKEGASKEPQQGKPGGRRRRKTSSNKGTVKTDVPDSIENEMEENKAEIKKVEEPPKKQANSDSEKNSKTEVGKSSKTENEKIQDKTSDDASGPVEG
ncbi:microcompartments protein [Dethiosulfovibrio peptidovorans DSM 11002]|uniref:Microcompartments protein n=1 Tax=Dethiosulfovibrio peptidovorans DSM 11002 TaxID=469381 RepID=D2Z8H0_9BACT|nr:microcompartments protein [Dethiosulfovibrio peptidovorans DSM 11002]